MFRIIKVFRLFNSLDASDYIKEDEVITLTSEVGGYVNTNICYYHTDPKTINQKSQENSYFAVSS